MLVRSECAEDVCQRDCRVDGLAVALEVELFRGVVCHVFVRNFHDLSLGFSIALELVTVALVPK